jgi:hypothetical protein
MIAAISGNALAELVDRQVLDELRKDGPSAVHVASKGAQHDKTANRNSNRLRTSGAFEPYKMGMRGILPKSYRTLLIGNNQEPRFFSYWLPRLSDNWRGLNRVV